MLTRGNGFCVSRLFLVAANHVSRPTYEAYAYGENREIVACA